MSVSQAVPPVTDTKLDQLCINTIRTLSIDAVHGATFFIFSDYARPAIRLATVMELPALFVFTHDAMGDGEDGPTHQPVEHLVSLRAIPGLITLRPGDANEVVEAYRHLMQLRHQPAVLALSRQPLPTLDRSKYAPASGSSHRHEDIRGIGATQGVAEEVRVRTGSRSCGRKEAIGEKSREDERNFYDQGHASGFDTPNRADAAASREASQPPSNWTQRPRRRRCRRFVPNMRRS
jgi:hypothetical protein